MKIEVDDKDVRTILTSLFLAKNRGAISESDYNKVRAKIPVTDQLPIKGVCIEHDACTG